MEFMALKKFKKDVYTTSCQFLTVQYFLLKKILKVSTLCFHGDEHPLGYQRFEILGEFGVIYSKFLTNKEIS